MISIRVSEMVSPTEIAVVAMGDNCEPVIDGEVYDWDFSGQDGYDCAVSAIVQKVQAGAGAVHVNSAHFRNRGVYDPEVGVIYANCYGVVKHAIIWNAEKVGQFLSGLNFGLKAEEETVVTEVAAKKIINYLNKHKFVEIKSGCASALMSEEEASLWCGLCDNDRNGNGDPQRSILRELKDSSEEWVFYSSLYGWVETKTRAEEILSE